MIEKWNFSDNDQNSSKQLINRQKSALRLRLIKVDREKKSGIFHSEKDGNIATTLNKCECYDFNYTGNWQRKKFSPCKHIYRLAIELGLMEPAFVDYKAKREDKEIEDLLYDSEKKLRSLKSASDQWGGWDAKIHKTRPQRNRQYRAYEIINEYTCKVRENSAVIGDYNVTLRSCDCFDFENRALPCKHIYCLALLKKINLYLTPEQHEEKKKEFIEDFDAETGPSISITASTLSKFDTLIYVLLKYVGLQKLGATYLSKRLKLNGKIV